MPMLFRLKSQFDLSLTFLHLAAQHPVTAGVDSCSPYLLDGARRDLARDKTYTMNRRVDDNQAI